MEKMKKIAKGTGKVFLALLTAVCMPILIWVALGVAINRKMAEKNAERKLAPAIDETLVANHATIQDKKP